MRVHKDAFSPEVEKLITIRECAKALRIHPTTLYRLVRDGAVPHARVGGGIRFRLSTVMQALEENHGK